MTSMKDEVSQTQIVNIVVELPERAHQYLGDAAKLATVLCELDSGDIVTFEMPKAAARLVKKDPILLPCSYTEAINKVMQRTEVSAFSQTLTFLKRREHSKGELANKLDREGYTQEVIKEALNRAEEMNYLNDARYADLFVRSKIHAGWGSDRIFKELKYRSVSDDVIRDALEANQVCDSEFDRAYGLLVRKMIPEKNSYQKLFRFLYSKGFTAEIARKAIEKRLTT